MGERVVPEPHRCHLTHAGYYRSALALKVPGEWNRFKYAGVPRSLALSGDGPDGESECVPRLVGDDRWRDGRLARPDRSGRAGAPGAPLPRRHVRLLVRVITRPHQRA